MFTCSHTVEFAAVMDRCLSRDAVSYNQTWISFPKTDFTLKAPAINIKVPLILAALYRCLSGAFAICSVRGPWQKLLSARQ